MTYASRGRHFEEFTAGETFTTAARTVTEGAVDRFAGLSGDFNPLHIDEESARQAPMKGRIAHDARAPRNGSDPVDGAGSARRHDPHGAHGAADARVIQARSRRPCPDVAVRNQRGEAVCQAEWTALMARRR